MQESFTNLVSTAIYNIQKEDIVKPISDAVGHEVVNRYKNEISARITEFVDKTDKMYLLLSLLETEKVGSVLIFVKTKFGADRVVEQLAKSNIEAAAIHSNKSQGARDKALNGFRTGEIKILVATDIAARGIDVDHVTHVVNFNLPEDASNYVHRIGRTARAGRDGVALTLCVISEFSLLKNVEKKIKMPIPAVTDQPFHKTFTKEALAEFKKKPTKRGKGKNSHKKRRRR